MILENIGYDVQRRFKRTFFIGRIGLFVDGKYNFYDSTMISEGGILLRSAAPLRRGQEIEAHFYLPNGEFIDAGGKIVYNIKEPDAIMVGVAFTALTARHQKLIQDYVRRH